MTIILCLDDKNGMMFNNRRQSRDKAVAADIIKITDKKRLLMNEYSAGFFPEKTTNMVIDEDFLNKSDDSDFCFVEDNDLKEFSSKINMIIIYRWNRVYPSDLKLEIPVNQWIKSVETEFAGNSHDKITKEVYIK